MIKIFFYPECEFRQNRQLIFDYKIPYDLVAASGGQTEGNLTFIRMYRHGESNPDYSLEKAAS